MAKNSIGKKIIAIITGIMCAIITVICAFIIFFNFTHSYCQVRGTSMYPTFNKYKSNEDAVFINKSKECTYGDIVIAERDIENGRKRIIKRVIAKGNDKIRIGLYNGNYEILIIYAGEEEPTVLQEDYLPEGYTNKYIANDFARYILKGECQLENDYLVIPEDYIFILGDNRDNGESYDSADYGPLPADRVVGKVEYIIYGGKWRYIQVLKQYFSKTKETT